MVTRRDSLADGQRPCANTHVVVGIQSFLPNVSGNRAHGLCTFVHMPLTFGHICGEVCGSPSQHLLKCTLGVMLVVTKKNLPN